MSYYEDYDEDYEPTDEEMEEMNGMENTEVKVEEQKMIIEFDTTNFAQGIMAAVASKVKQELYQQVVNEIKKECLDGIKEKIQQQTGEIIRGIINDYMENEKVTIGGDGIWDETPKEELTLIQYAKRCVKNIIEEQTFKVVVAIEEDRYDKGRYKAKTQEWTFDKYLQAHLGIDNEVKEYLDKEVEKIRKEINYNVKTAFDESTRSMLSQAVLNVLMANDTYKKIEGSIASIANRATEQ